MRFKTAQKLWFDQNLCKSLPISLRFIQTLRVALFHNVSFLFDDVTFSFKMKSKLLRFPAGVMVMFSLQNKFLVFVITILSFSTTWARVEAVIGKVPVAKNPNMVIAAPETDNSEIMISRDQYVISYNKNRRAPNWVAWKLEASQLGKSGRSNKFQLDTDLDKYLAKNGNLHAVKPTDYKGSCFDRGHQVPSGDRTDTKANNEATFMMSNMIPQTPYLNRVVWEHLESYTRDLVQKQGKKVYVIAGPIYDIDFGAIGPDKDIAVPSKDFKIIFVLDKSQTAADINQSTPMITVIMPNTLKGGVRPIPSTPNCGGDATVGTDNTDDWKQYQTTIADVESRAGMTFRDLSFAVAH